ncbi:MAG TPA: DUF397 domain-containing protein [Acidimicrobiales bacterium]|jgi:hypothetical protein
MTDTNPPVTDSELVGLQWRTSTYGGDERDSVEVAQLRDGRTALRNRNHHEQGVVVFTPSEIEAWIKGCKAGEFDDLG